MTLGDKVKALRERHGWSQRELSRRSGVRQALISELELNKKEETTSTTLRRLAQTLGVSMDYLGGMFNELPSPSPAEQPAVESIAALPVTPSLERIEANV
jgi:transcriptional regulator with XRE-family HTH domain